MNARALGAGGLLLLLCGVAEAQERRPPPPPVPPGVRALRDLAYVPDGHPRQRLDLYLPQEKPARPLPVLVWVHGGAWLGGDKGRPPALPFVARGYAVASINYRLSQHAKFPAQLEDCKAAVRWLRAHAKEYDLDADRVGAWGASAGGHLVALLGTTGGVKELEGAGGNADQSSRVQAVVDFFGPTDFLRMGGSHDRPGSPEARLIGGPVQDNKDKAAKANPITYVSKAAAPFLILHGDRDETVPFNQSELLAQALKKAGVEVKLVPLQGAGHGGPAFNGPASRKEVEEFFDRHLKKAKAARPGGAGRHLSFSFSRTALRPLSNVKTSRHVKKLSGSVRRG